MAVSVLTAGLFLIVSGMASRWEAHVTSSTSAVQRKRLLSPSRQLLFGALSIFVGRAPPLILAKQDLPDFLQILQRRFVVVAPTPFVCPLGLEAPGAIVFDHTNFAFHTILGASCPGVPVVHNGKTLVCGGPASTLIPFPLERCP